MTERRPWLWMTVSLALLCCGLALFSGRAWAAWVDVTETGAPGLLSLRSQVESPQFEMSPGSVKQWQIRADLVGPHSPLTLQFTRDGELAAHPNGLIVQLQGCAAEWTSLTTVPVCSSGAISILGPIAASDPSLGAMVPDGVPAGPGAPVYLAGSVSSSHSAFVLVTMSLPDTAEARADETLMGLEATMGVGFTASGDDVPPTGPPGKPSVAGLSNTGLDILAILMTAAGALGTGLILRNRHSGRAGGAA